MKIKYGLGLLITLFGAVYHSPGTIARSEVLLPELSIERIAPPDEMIREVFVYINQARSKPCKCGNKRYGAVPPLVYNEKLAAAAQNHTNWMASTLKLSHTQPKRNVANAWDRIAQQDYKWSLVEENIAAGQPTAREVVDDWIKSPGHCKNLMDGAIKEVGVGFKYTASGNYHYYWTADFATSQQKSL
ncbi:CAP domain-containing protein [Spirosoma sp.]|uniref:CAP domain-containing protein n=1 Tax=Spirosoma sp. TaxID=1899569 RepID=UPI003B39FF8A